MYIELIKSLTDDCEFSVPATENQLAAAERELGVEFPKELKDFLTESNGVMGDYGDGIVWSAERILADNIEFRTFADFKKLYMPFDCLLFFGDIVNGDQFAYAVLDGEICKNDIFLWNHENDSRTWAASNLRQYLEFALKGQFD